MFRRQHEPADPVRFTFDGQVIAAERGETVAVALLASGVRTVRTSVVGGEPRAPYCLMGVCFDCLVTIDGAQNRNGCLTVARDGMLVESQSGRRRVGVETGA
ncbi:(2Fe-2S)-binding protein [Azospirillum sp. A29]|uniref:(2Fe-2S)-binding protein n=1 Tax=Azospirillum sp. A29 TaxID=3160606 RepID=UPI00366DAEC3